MTLLCHCLPCVFRTASQEANQRVVLEELREEVVEVVSTSKPKHRHGIHWRVYDIITRQCANDLKLMHRLLGFSDKILSNSGFVKVSAGDAEILHNVLNTLPTEQEARSNCRDLIQVLEKDGIDMSILDSAKDTPLLRAIKTRNFSAVDALLHTNCDINATDKYSSTCLIYAVQYNEKETVQTILRRFPNKVSLDRTDYANYTALAYAASNNNLDLCSLLLDAGARTDVNSTSPLYLAVSNNVSHGLIQLLISRGASVNVSSADGMNALTAAAKNKQPGIVSFLLENGASYANAWYKNPAFMTALQMDHLEILKIFIDVGVDILCSNPKGLTAVHEACCQGSVQFLSYVITTTDLNLDARDRLRRTAAHVAAQYGHSVCLEVLFFAGADCWSQDPRRQTALEIALFHNRSECVSFFVNRAVFPRQKLFSIQHMLENDYDPDALSRKPAVGLFSSLLQLKWDETRQVDTLFQTSLIAVRRFLRQKPASKVLHLPLPERVKDAILTFK